MSASNLPPGVSESMIPGNRPEDLWLDKFYDEVEIPSELYELPVNLVAVITSMFLSRLGEAIGLAYQAGRNEVQFDDALGSRRAQGGEQDG